MSPERGRGQAAVVGPGHIKWMKDWESSMPPGDGKPKWLKGWVRNVPPLLPSEAHIA